MKHKKLIFSILGITTLLTAGLFAIKQPTKKVKADTITDLTGCTWTANTTSPTYTQTINYGDASGTYPINGYMGTNPDANKITAIQIVPSTGKIVYLRYMDSNLEAYSSGHWRNGIVIELKFTGGTSVNNPTFITFLQNNGTITQPVYYTATFNNWNGNLLWTENVIEGNTATYGGSTPTRPNDSNYSYTFSGWNPSISTPITANTTFTAQYTAVPLFNTYTATFKNYDGTTLYTTSVRENETAIYGGSTPTRPDDSNYSYTFTGWNPSISTPIIANTTFTAQFQATLINVEPGIHINKPEDSDTITIDVNPYVVNTFNNQATGTIPPFATQMLKAETTQNDYIDIKQYQYALLTYGQNYAPYMRNLTIYQITPYYTLAGTNMSITLNYNLPNLQIVGESQEWKLKYDVYKTNNNLSSYINRSDYNSITSIDSYKSNMDINTRDIIANLPFSADVHSLPYTSANILINNLTTQTQYIVVDTLYTNEAGHTDPSSVIVDQGQTILNVFNTHLESTIVVNPTTEIVDIPGLMLEIISMPFAFISQAFNLTLFPGTAYQINISNIFLGFIAIALLLWILKLILGKADIGEWIAEEEHSRKQTSKKLDQQDKSRKQSSNKSRKQSSNKSQKKGKK